MKTKSCLLTLAVAVMINTTACMGADGAFADTSKDKTKILTVECELGSESVPYKEYRYFYMNNKKDLYGADAETDGEMTAKIRGLTEDNIRLFHAVNLAAGKHGAKLNKEEKQSVENYTKSYRKESGLDDSEYKAMLEQHFITDSFFEALFENSLLSDKLFEKLIEESVIPGNDKVADEIFETDEILCLKEIFIRHNGGETVGIAKTRAEEVYEKLIETGDFEALMEEYSDYNAEQLPPEHGYYTAEYDAIEPVWKAACDLAEGEYSAVVESAYGFHIIMRCEKDAEYMRENRDGIILMYQQSEYTEYILGIADQLTLTYTKQGEELDLNAME